MCQCSVGLQAQSAGTDIFVKPHSLWEKNKNILKTIPQGWLKDTLVMFIYWATLIFQVHIILNLKGDSRYLKILQRKIEAFDIVRIFLKNLLKCNPWCSKINVDFYTIGTNDLGLGCLRIVQSKIVSKTFTACRLMQTVKL